MIVTWSKRKRTLLVLGLTGRDIQRLQSGDRLLIDDEKAGRGCPVDIFLLAAETGRDILRALAFSPEAAAAAPPVPMFQEAVFAHDESRAMAFAVLRAQGADEAILDALAASLAVRDAQEGAGPS